jgi:hypothetical protein
MRGEAWPILGAMASTFAFFLLFVVVDHLLSSSNASISFTIEMNITAFIFLPLLALNDLMLSLPTYMFGGVLLYFGVRRLEGISLFIYLTILFGILTFLLMYIAAKSLAGV